MSVSLDILRTYNCRTESGVVKRGRVLDDWPRYGVYYGTPSYLQIHDFSNWDVLVFDYAVLAQGVNPEDYEGVDIYIYIAFGGRYNIAARTGGYYPPNSNASELLALRETVHREIDAVIDAGFAGVFWDECDTGYWDWSYSLETSQILKNQLQEYCDYIRSRGGKNFINGCPWFANCGENYMLESFLSSWSHNLFDPDWSQTELFIKYQFGLEELGESGGIPWTTGIYSWLYCKQYAPNVDIFAHSYGDPESVWQYDKQLYSLSGSLAIGLYSYNYIEPTNQTLIPLWAHNYYVGAPLECPQFDVSIRKVTREYTGASVTFDEANSEGIIDMNVKPDYWWTINRGFEDVDWEVDGNEIAGSNRISGFTPEYLKIKNVYSYDDKLEVYFRLEMEGSFVEADVIPLFFYIQINPDLDGFQVARTTTDVPYLYFANIKAQMYLYGKTLFYWVDGGWTYLYPCRYEQDSINNYIYYAIRKETLAHAAPGWDKENLRILPLFVYSEGNSFFTNDDNASYEACLPVDTLNYGPEYDLHSYKPFTSCPLPVIGSDDELLYNQVQSSPTVCSHHFTIYGYAECSLILTENVYSPHSAVIYSGEGEVNKRISQVAITGNFDKAWIFDRETGRFVGPDDTMDTYFTASPFSPTKIIDGQDVYVAIAHDDTSITADTWNVSAVDVTLVNWASTHSAGYDIPLPDLIEWQSVYDRWKEEVVSETVENLYLPSGVKRGGINLRRDSLKGTFLVSVPSSGSIVEALETYDITNAALLMRRTYEDLDHSDPDNTELLVWAYVDSWELTDTELRIRAKLNFHNWGGSFPKRRASYFCPFVFKGPQCSYGGADLTCDKTLTTCTGFGNDANFGGIPTLPRLQRGKWG